MQPWPIILEFVLKKQNRFHMENEYFKFITKIPKFSKSMLDRFF